MGAKGQEARITTRKERKLNDLLTNERMEMRLAEMLRLYIAANGLEQKAVATEIGVSESTLSRFVSGNAVPDAIGFMRIIAWATGGGLPKGNEIERRVRKLEAQAEANAPAMQAAWMQVPIGGARIGG